MKHWLLVLVTLGFLSCLFIPNVYAKTSSYTCGNTTWVYEDGEEVGKIVQYPEQVIVYDDTGKVLMNLKRNYHYRGSPSRLGSWQYTIRPRYNGEVGPGESGYAR